MRKYPTLYQDKFGKETSEFSSNGSDLYITLRGIEFEGGCFEALEGKIDKSKFEYVEFQGEENFGDLKNCKFKVIFPAKFIVSNEEKIGSLKAEIQLEHKEDYGVKLLFQFKSIQISNSKSYGHFESAIIEIQKKLPNNFKLKNCLSCKYSHYHPLGNGLFGDLYCFKKIKGKTKKIINKETLFSAWDKNVFNTQETYDCEDHKFVESNKWYYKDWR